MRKILALIPAAALIVSTAWGQFSQEAEVVTVPVADGVHMFMAAGGNIGVLSGEEGVFLIDDQYAPMVPRIKAAAEKLTSAPVRMIVNTHWHGDHAGGNERFGEEGVVIMAHDNVRKRMSKSHFSKFFLQEVPPSPAAALPVITFSDGVSVHLNGQTLNVEHVAPAHTDGDSIIWFVEANAVHLGDLFFNGLYPFIDLDSGGDVRGMVRAAEYALSRVDADTKIMPGHGPLADRDDLEEYIRMLKTSIEGVANLVDDGKTLNEVIAAKPSAEFDDKWGQAFIAPDRWAALLYRGLGGQE